MLSSIPGGIYIKIRMSTAFGVAITLSNHEYNVPVKVTLQKVVEVPAPEMSSMHIFQDNGQYTMN